MHIKWHPHRFLLRQYLYPFLFLILLFFLIRWNSSSRKGPTGSRWQDAGSLELTLAESALVDGNVVQIAKEVERVKGNSVALTVYMEAQCPDTTGFIKRQLVPSWEKLRTTRRVNVTIVPFGKAKCEPDGDDFQCYCQHGPAECELNQLMNCVIDQLVSPDHFVPLIGCIQGESDLSSAHKSCLASHPHSKWIMECARGRRGRYLHALAGKKTAALGDEFNFVPWVVLDGKRVNDAFYALEENLCKRLDAPKPSQCGGA